MVETLELYVKLLCKLHILIAEGQCDSVEADGVRDEMDGPWHEMTTIDRSQMRELAAHLNRFSVGEV